MVFMCLRPSFFFQAEDGIRDYKVTGVQTCALPILPAGLLLTALGLLLAEAARRPLLAAIGSAAWRWAVVAAAGRVLFHPFHEHFATSYKIGRASCRERV